MLSRHILFDAKYVSIKLSKRRIMISEKVIIIDDDQRIIKSVEIALNEYEFVAFTDAQKAIEYIKKPHQIHLVLLDVMMPTVNGLDVLSQIKKIRPDMKVIMITGHCSKDIVIEALRRHADDFVEKPVQMGELKEKMVRLIWESKRLEKELNPNDKVERIKNFIDRNYRNVNLDYIAEEMRLSSKYVSRIFINNHGTSFRGYKIQKKMEKAKFLLANTGLDIKEIAYDLGYQNPESFMRTFKLQEKVTPSEYRQQQEKQKG